MVTAKNFWLTLVPLVARSELAMFLAVKATHPDLPDKDLLRIVDREIEDRLPFFTKRAEARINEAASGKKP
ncbi:hypothetical protein K8I61_17160 [bacterium]|nr:hypothetical protein [bacterium]